MMMYNVNNGPFPKFDCYRLTRHMDAYWSSIGGMNQYVSLRKL